MDSTAKANLSPKESETLLQDQLSLVSKSKNGELSKPFLPDDGKITITAKKEIDAVHWEDDTTVSVKPPVAIELHVYENKKIFFNKHLIPLRIALFLWFGAGRLPASFLSVFMKHRGLSLIEFSSVFSITFLCQFLSASVSGIIADKIGNAKPVLMFHMLATLSVIICMLLAPSIDIKSCDETKMNLTCSNVAEIAKNLRYCNFSCSIDSSESNLSQEINQSISMFSNSNGSFLEPSNLFVDYNESHVNIPSVNSPCDVLNEMCATSCNNCSTQKGLVILYAILILCFFTVWSTVYRFMDIISMALATKHGSNVGRERFVANIGELTVACVAVFVLSADTETNVKKNYDSVYWVSATFVCLSFIAVCNIKSHINPPGRKLWKKAFKLMRNIDVMAFIAVVFVSGNAFCFYTNFSLYFLDYLKAPKMLLGLHSVTLNTYAIFVLWTFEWWFKKLGATKIFVLSLLSYTVSATAYSFLYNPWLSLIIESTNAFSYHLFWVTVITHSHNIAPEGMVATVNAIAGAIHFGIGRSTGIFGGSLLMDTFGPRVTYRTLATICFTTAILYSTFLYGKHVSDKDKTRENGKEDDYRRV